MQNDLQEFYSIIEFVNPGILGTSAAYRKIYEEPILRSRQPTCAEVAHTSKLKKSVHVFSLHACIRLCLTLV